MLSLMFEHRLVPERGCAAVPGGGQVEWKPSTWMRAFGLAVSIGLDVVACVCVWQACTEPGGWGLAPEGLLMAGFSVFGLRYVARSRITLTPDTLSITNAFKAYTVPLAEITGVSATPGGLRISRAGQPAIVAGAVQKSRWAVDHGEQQTRADDAASDILTAVSRLTSKRNAPL